MDALELLRRNTRNWVGAGPATSEPWVELRRLGLAERDPATGKWRLTAEGYRHRVAGSVPAGLDEPAATEGEGTEDGS